MSSDRAEEFRGNADECRRQAQRSLCHEDKARWLKLAEGWQKLAENTEADDLKMQGSIPLHNVPARSQDAS
jgi:hypothetical protein